MEKVIGAYDTFKPEIKMWAFYTCLFLKWHNMKTLVLTTEKNVFKDVPYDWSTLNDSNFKIVDTQLREVCGNEFHDGIIRQEIESKRKNHLSYPNHVVLYNFISNFYSSHLYALVLRGIPLRNNGGFTYQANIIMECSTEQIFGGKCSCFIFNFANTHLFY